MKKMLDKNDDSKKEVSMENQSVAETLAIGSVNKSALYKDQKMLSIRCSTSCQQRLDNLMEKFPCFTKQYLLSLCLDIALTELCE